jgi:23S rRNA-/tRNA-specific pseudouridylate synthase
MKKPRSQDRSKKRKPNRHSAQQPSAHEDTRRPRFSLEPSVLYEDDAVIVIDKPAGLLAVP